MKNAFLRTIKTTLFFITFLTVSSCALRPIPSEYSFIKTGFDNVDLNNLGNGKVLIYNGADIMHKIDNTSRLNIWIDNKPLGQIRASEYVVVDLKYGKHLFKALHLDMVNMRSTDTVTIDENLKVIKIKPNLTSNRLTVTNELPKNFNKFKYAVNK